MAAKIVSTEILAEFPTKEVSRDEFFAAMHRIWDKIRDKGLKVSEVNVSINNAVPSVRFKVFGKETEEDWMQEKAVGDEPIVEVAKEVQ